jgi:hypothetical protein
MLDNLRIHEMFIAILLRLPVLLAALAAGRGARGAGDLAIWR